MAGLIHNNARNRPNKKDNPLLNRPIPDAPVFITDAAIAGSVLTLTLSEAVGLDGVPQFTTDVAGAVPVSAIMTSPIAVAITFDAAIDAATTINIPFRDRAIRNSSGGYVTSNTFPVAA